MPSAGYDPESRLRQSRETVQRAADQLHETLVELATKLEPFPYFLGSIEVRAIEAEPGGAPTRPTAAASSSARTARCTSSA